MTIAENIRRLREKYDLTQDELGEIAGVSGGAVSTWERGVAEPRMGAIQRMSDRLHISKLDIVGDETPSNIILPAAYPVPILGTICAGDGIWCEENYEGMFFLDKSIRADFSLRVSGDSMIEEGIFDGDMAFFQKDFNFTGGKIYAVLLSDENEAVIKKVHAKGDTVILSPANSSYEPMIEAAENVLIVGECVGVYHWK